MRTSTPRTVLLVLLAVAVAGLLGGGCSRARVQQYLERAEVYYQANEYDKAEIEYLNVLRRQGTNTLVIKRLGMIYMDQGEVSRAYAFLAKAQQLEPTALDVRLKLGSIYASARKLKEARAEADFVLERDPKNEDALLLLSNTAFTGADLQATEQRLRQLGQKTGDSAGLQLALGNLLGKQQKLKEAEDAFKKALALDPKSGSAHMALAALYWAQNDLAQADREFKAAIESAPPRSPRRLHYASFKLKTEKVDEAKAIVEAVTKQAPDYVPGWIFMAQIAFAERRWDDAKGVVEKALARDPASYEALLLTARLGLAKDDPKQALADFERMLKFYPQSPAVHYEMAVAHLRADDVVKAMSSLNLAMGLDPKHVEARLLFAELTLRKGELNNALTALSQLVKEQPRLAPAQLLLADAYRARGDLNEALAVYRRLAEMAPKMPQPPLLMGLVLRQLKQDAEARQAFAKCLEIAPDFLAATEQLVEMDLTDNKDPDALSRIQKLLDKNPKAPAPLLLLARIQYAPAQRAQEQRARQRAPQGQPTPEQAAQEQRAHDQAEATLAKLIEANPDYRPAYMMLVRLYVISRKQAQALDGLQAVVAKNPKDTAALLQMAMIYNQQKEYAKARDAYEKVLAANPKATAALNDLAYLYSEQFKQLDKAFELAKRARDLSPLDPYAADTLGWIVCQRGDYAWALNVLREAAEKLPTQGEVQYHLGMAHYLLGEEAVARATLLRALALSTEFNGRDQAESALAVLNLDTSAGGDATVALLQKRLEEAPQDTVALLKLGAVREREGAFDKARDLYERALRANPKSVAVLVRLAQLYADRLQQSAKAIQLAKDARALAPEDPSIAATLGKLAYQAGDQKWALSLLQQAAQKLTDDPAVIYDLALAEYSQGKVSEAEAAAKKAVTLIQQPGPKPASAGSVADRLAAAKLFLETLGLARNPAAAAQAEARLQNVLKADPNLLPALMASGLAREQRGDRVAATKVYETILARYPGFSPATRALALLATADPASDLQKTFDLAMKAREAFPDDPEVAKALGAASYRKGDFNRAVQLLKETTRKRATDAEAFFYLGMSQLKLQQNKEAGEALQKALTLKLDTRLAEEAKQALARLTAK